MPQQDRCLFTRILAQHSSMKRRKSTSETSFLGAIGNVGKTAVLTLLNCHLPAFPNIGASLGTPHSKNCFRPIGIGSVGCARNSGNGSGSNSGSGKFPRHPRHFPEAAPRLPDTPRHFPEAPRHSPTLPRSSPTLPRSSPTLPDNPPTLPDTSRVGSPTLPDWPRVGPTWHAKIAPR